MNGEEPIPPIEDLVVIEDEEPTPQQKPKTATRQFIEALLPYGDEETAKAHIPEIAEKLGCAKSLGYKALRRIKNRKLWATGATIEPEEPTLKIHEVEPEPIATTEPEPEKEEEEIIEEPTEQPPAMVESETIIKLRPILERGIGRIFDNTMDFIAGKTEEAYLTTQETKDTATLIPFLLFRVTKQKLSEDNFIDLTTGIHFGSIVLKVVKAKWKEHKRKQTMEKQREEAQQQKPPEPKPEEQKPLEKPPDTIGKDLLKRLGEK